MAVAAKLMPQKRKRTVGWPASGIFIPLELTVKMKWAFRAFVFIPQVKDVLRLVQPMGKFLVFVAWQLM